MKLKKFFAAVLAGAVALSSFSLSAFAAAGGDGAATSTEHEIFKFEAGVIANWSNIRIAKEKFETAEAGQDLVIVCSPTADATNSQLAVKNPDGDWPAIDNAEETYAISAADTSTTIALSATAVTDAQANGIAISGQQISVKTVSLDGTVIYDSATEKGLAMSWQDYTIATPTQLTEWGVTKDNIADCSVTLTLGEEPTAGFVGILTKIDYNDELTEAQIAGSNADLSGVLSKVYSFENINNAWVSAASAGMDATEGPNANGITIKLNDVCVKSIVFTTPGTTGGEDPGDSSDVDTSGWQIAAYLFGEGWDCDWENGAVTSDTGVLTLTTTLGAIKTKCAVSGAIGGLNLQVWNASPIGGKVAYAILVKDAGDNTILERSGNVTVAEGEYGADCPLGQFCTEICYGPFKFSDSDTLMIAVAAGTTPPTIDAGSSGGSGGSDTPVIPGAPSGSGTVTFPSSPSTGSSDNNNNDNDNNNDDKTEIIDPETLPVKFEDDDNETGVEVAAPEDAFDDPENITFNAEPIAEETDDKDTFTFDFNFTDKDGNEVQPKSAVTVSVPVPAALTGKTVFVYHIENNGSYTEVNCKVENGKILFTAKSFSKYVITSQKLSANGEPVTTEPDATTPNPGSTNEPNVATGVGGVAVVLGVAAMAAGAMIVSKKRK